MCDLTRSSDVSSDDGITVISSANTVEGEQLLGAPTLSVPLEEAN
jgi:hypothetical protein